MPTDKEVIAEKRRNLIKTIEEVKQIAEACGQEAVQGVLCALQAALEEGTEVEFFEHCILFTTRQLERLLERRAST